MQAGLLEWCVSHVCGILLLYGLNKREQRWDGDDDD